MTEEKPSQCIECKRSNITKEGLGYWVTCKIAKKSRRVYQDNGRPEWCPLNKPEEQNNEEGGQS